jgi:Flp pilus assembly pilin Flp
VDWGELPPQFTARTIDWRSRVMPSPDAVALLKRLAKAQLSREEDGQDLIEYGLLMALIAVFAIGAISTVGNTINSVFWQVIANTY